jgi:hypothetical protein
MKKFLIVSLLLIVACGPSEDEIQARIDNAVEQATSTTSSTTTSSTTSTTIKRVVWTPSEINLTCPNSRDLMRGSKFKAGFDVKFGSNPSKISLTLYNFKEKEEQLMEWTPRIDPTITWEEGSRKSYFPYDTDSLARDYEFFYFKVEVEDSSGVVSKECDIKNDVDIYSLPPIAETSECPKTAGQNEEVNVILNVTSRTADVEYIQWEFQDDTKLNNYADLLDTNDLPKKEYRTNYPGLKYNTGFFNSGGNLTIIATVYDSFGRSSKAVCGIKLEP